MIKMTRVYGNAFVPKECCTFTNPTTSEGKMEIDDINLPCGNGCNGGCEKCVIQKIMNEYAEVTGQSSGNRHCEECAYFKEVRKGPRGGKRGICRILKPSEIRTGRGVACKRFREEKNEQTTGKETV